jgi:hypothetical protein
MNGGQSILGQRNDVYRPARFRIRVACLIITVFPMLLTRCRRATVPWPISVGDAIGSLHDVA